MVPKICMTNVSFESLNTLVYCNSVTVTVNNNQIYFSGIDKITAFLISTKHNCHHGNNCHYIQTVHDY